MIQEYCVVLSIAYLNQESLCSHYLVVCHLKTSYKFYFCGDFQDVCTMRHGTVSYTRPVEHLQEDI